MPVTESSRVGPYVVVARLGAGGMGEVWRAHDPRLGRDVALKVLPETVAADADRVARFQSEARAASLLNHPNVVTVYDVGQEDGTAWLAMELLEGLDLRRFLDRGMPPLRTALGIAVQIADGLAATHAKGIVHRDLKPENVVVSDDGLVKILDFGIAKSSPLAASGADETMPEAFLGTEPGAFLGTIGYMSPEQAAGEPADFRSDQFSFGTILYELVTGVRAWKKPTAAETLVAIMKEEPPAFTSAEPIVPASVRQIVERCLSKNPSHRFDSTRDLAADVRSLLDNESNLLPRRQPPVPRSLGAARPRTTFVGLGVAALAAVGTWFWMRMPPGVPAIESLAVLPFENGSREADSEYLSDGIAESLIDRLARLPALRVMARATVFRFRNAPDPQVAGRKLNVRAVVTGTVTRRDERLLITVEALEVKTGARLWGNRYDRPFADLVRLEAEIASDLSAGIRLPLSDPERRILGRQGTENSEAYDLFLKGRYASLKDTEPGYLEAIRMFREASAKDPRFAEAHLWEADTYGEMVSGGYVKPAEAWARSDEGSWKALALDPGLSDARAALASRLAYFDWDLAGAEREFRALFDGPRPPLWHSRAFALLLWARGKTEESIVVTERARERDPGNLVYTVSSADYRAQTGRLGEAVGLYRAALEVDPEDPRSLFGLAGIFRMRGELPQAIETLRRAYELSNEGDGVKALTGARTSEDYDAAQLSVARVRLGELYALARNRYVSPLDIARLQALVGEKERAFASLDAAFAERSGGLVFLNVDRAWDGIRNDARFASLVRRVGLP
jgi:serine/threonine protein kinase/tetratricopeptide (TPR) repeat protein